MMFTRRNGKTEQTIARKNMKNMAFLGLFLILGSCMAAGLSVYKRNIRIYTEHVYSCAHQIADNISGIAPMKYLETETKDEEYYDIRYTLMSYGIFEEEFRDFYFVIPTEEDLVYISESYHNLKDDDQEAYNRQAGFLEHRPYRPGEKEAMMEVLEQDEKGIEKKGLFMGLRELSGEKLATALVSVHAMQNEVPALVGVDISLEAMWRSIVMMFLNIAIALTVITSIGMVFRYRVLDRTLIRPLTSLKKETDGLVEKLDSEEPFISDVHTGDELEMLAHSIEEMDRNLKHYIKENTAITAERERLSTELALAARIQEDMLPNQFPPFPDRKEFEIYASMDPAKEVGGDFYDFFLIDQDHLCLVIADVSGKGIPAALFMMMVKIMVQNCVMAGFSVKQAMEQVNSMVCGNSSEGMFVTVWLGILDIPSGKLTAVNAGHEYPMLKWPDACFELIKDKHGIAVGVMDGVPYREYELQLMPGSTLFVYTDGLPEAVDSSEQLFGTERTLSALNEEPEADTETILGSMKRAVEAFVDEAPQFDDLTMLCVKYNGPSCAVAH